MKLSTLAVASALALGTGLAALPAAAQQRITVNIGSSHPTSNIWAYAMKEVFQPEVDRILKAGGGKYEVRWRENYGGTLYKFTDTRTAVRDGIVDVGMVGTVWENSAMPLQNVTYFTPFATTNHELLIEIFDKLNTTVPALRESWAAQNMVPLSSLITDSYDIYANFPIRTMADLHNKKINAPGTSANWLRETGATPVDGALTTYYTNIQTGVTQGALSFASGIGPARVYEVAKYLTRVDVGSMYFGSVAANKKFHDALPKEVQDAFAQAGKATSKAHGQHVTKTANAALDTMKAAGLQIADLPAAEKAKWVNGLPNIVQPWLQTTGDKGKAVLKAYFDELRAHGVKPLRDWDGQNR
ncbi:C4-dicarboxylate TRAP transporter substrate-binding protein [Hydrogenophaga borbori]|uniref:C4-dicarboxylate TRAP transporter substrate-binding protein n=1 Tax=Hydrogenophaga borbori TaxID=2294117 RepID=UPI00301E35F7